MRGEARCGSSRRKKKRLSQERVMSPAPGLEGPGLTTRGTLPLYSHAPAGSRHRDEMTHTCWLSLRSQMSQWECGRRKRYSGTTACPSTWHLEKNHTNRIKEQFRTTVLQWVGSGFQPWLCDLCDLEQLAHSMQAFAPPLSQAFSTTPYRTAMEFGQEIWLPFNRGQFFTLSTANVNQTIWFVECLHLTNTDSTPPTHQALHQLGASKHKQWVSLAL